MITIEDWALRETIAIKDVEISQLKDEIRRLEEQLRLAQIDNNLLLQKEVALEAEVERMKCCGNCVNYTYDTEEDHYYCNRHIFNGRLHANVCSNHWETDGLTAEKRK